MNPARVLVITPLGRGGQGGIDRMMDQLRPRDEDFARAGLDVRYQTSRGSGSLLLAPFYTGAAIARVAATRPDVVHINLSSHGSALRKLAIAAAARLSGSPYVLHLHGSGFRDYWDRADPRLSRRIGFLFESAARVLVLGKVWREYVSARAPAAADNIEILPNASPAPVGIRAFNCGAPARILFLGQIGPRKGVPELLAALAGLGDAPPWRATLAGNGAVTEARQTVERAGLAACVNLPGWVGPDAVGALLADCDIVVLPSHEENLPMSVIEGMAYGRAVIATPVGAVEDIVEHDKTGLLTPVGDVPALTAALRRLIGDAALRQRLGAAAAARHREGFDLDGYVGRLAEIWRRAAKARAKSVSPLP